MKGNN